MVLRFGFTAVYKINSFTETIWNLENVFLLKKIVLLIHPPLANFFFLTSIKYLNKRNKFNFQFIFISYGKFT